MTAMELRPHLPAGEERRIHKRYRVKDETFAFLGHDTGTVVDISKGGLSLHFTVFDKEPVIPSHLDIFLAENRFYLPRVPVSLVDAVQTVPASAFSFLRVKRLCMKFGPLSAEQQTRIEDFITRNTVTDN